MKNTKNNTYKRPKWIPKDLVQEEELCPDCFKVVGEKSRYNMVCALGKAREGLTVNQITSIIGLTQPTVTHHLKTLLSVNALHVKTVGREKFFTLNREAHCFLDCKIPY